tara:strand:+ start:825 stop:1139 length:315 start_codon:yes stop_codon:yes gene_type:complete
MFLKYIKIITLLISFIFLTGFLPFISLIGPGYTVLTSGSIYKAGGQFFISKSIKNTTGKNSLAFIKEKIENKNNTNHINEQLKILVERRIELARKNLNLKNINQ